MVIPLVLCAFLFFYRLADRDLWASHEARAAQDAQSVLSGRDWLLPRLYDGRVEMQKPPLYYWLVARAAKLRGQPVDAWAVRLPSALAALLGVLALWLFGWSQGRPLAGFLAALVLATAQHYTWLARVGRIDMPLTLMITIALFAYYRASGGVHPRRPWMRAARWLWFLLLYLALAAGVMLKGPIALVLPGTVIVAHLLVERFFCQSAIRNPQSAIHLLWGVPFLLALTLPWYLYANAQTGGEFFRVFFWHHNVARGLGGAEALEARPWWFYGPRFAFDFLPWSPLLAMAAWLAWRRRWWRIDAEARFGLVWFGAMLLLLSCATFKRADYLLPAFPGAALFIGCVAERWWRERRGRTIVWEGEAPVEPRQVVREGEAPAEPKQVDGSAGASPSLVPVSRGKSETEPRPSIEAEPRGSAFPGGAWERGVGALFLVTALVFVPLGWWIYLEHVLPAEEPCREQRTFAAEIRKLVPAPKHVLFFRAESHALAFHLGPPVRTFLEWENLDKWAARPGPNWIVMPPECAAQWPRHVRSGRLEEVLRNTDLSDGRHVQPLVLMRTVAR